MPFINNPASVKFPDESNVNVVKWSGTPVSALTAERYLQVDLVRWGGFAPQLLPGNSSPIPVNVAEWRGAVPNPVTAAGHMQSDVVAWKAESPGGLHTGAVPSNLSLWKGAVPNDLVDGNVPIPDVGGDSRWAIRSPYAITKTDTEASFGSNQGATGPETALAAVTEDILILGWGAYNKDANNLGLQSQPLSITVSTVTGTVTTAIFNTPFMTNHNAHAGGANIFPTAMNWQMFPLPLHIPSSVDTVQVELFRGRWAGAGQLGMEYNVALVWCPATSVKSY